MAGDGWLVSPDCRAYRWQFNQYRHTLSVFLSGASSASIAALPVWVGTAMAAVAVAVVVVAVAALVVAAALFCPALPRPLLTWPELQAWSHCLFGRFAESGQPAERLRRQHLSQQLLLPPLQTAGDGTAGSSRDMCALPQVPLCSCRDGPDAYGRIIARRPLLYSLLEPSTRGAFAPDAQPLQPAPEGEAQGFRADGTATMRSGAGATSRGFDPAPFCFTTEPQ